MQVTQTVYEVQGLGFGDDEHVWEHCSTHATREGADAARTLIVEDGCDPSWVRVEPVEVQE